MTTPKYKYVDLGLFNIKNVDLSRKVRFKVHKEYGDRREDRTARDKGIKIGRFYRDFQDYLELNPTCSIVGMVMNFPIRKASKFPLKQESDYPKCFSAAQTLHGRRAVSKKTTNTFDTFCLKELHSQVFRNRMQTLLLHTLTAPLDLS